MEPRKIAERRHLVHLTGFRAIAAYLVLIGHSADTTFFYWDKSYANTYVACLAYLGMSTFFVLSGFVITYTYYDRFIQLPWYSATREFAVARFARLYPLYILFLFWGKARYRHALLRDGTLADKASFLTLTQSWWNAQNLTFPPSWSISTECFFYLCFALWMLSGVRSAIPRTHVRRSILISLTAFFLVLVATFLAKIELTELLTPLLSHASNSDVWGWLVYCSPYVRIGEFIAGACAARMFMVTQHDEHPVSQQLGADLLCAGSCIAILALMIGNAVWFPRDGFLFLLSQNFGYAPFLAYLFYACSRYPNALTNWCSTHPMQIGGEISYSLYIVQFWIFWNVIETPVAGAPSHLAYEISVLKAVLFVILTTIAAYGSYRVIEVPSKRFIRRWLR